MIRFAFIMFCVFLFFVPFGIPALLVLWIIGLFSKEARFHATRAVIFCALRLLIFLSGVKLNYVGLENLPPVGTPCLFVSNHRSFYDMIIGLPMLKGNVRFIAKKEWEKTPFLGWWMMFLECFFLDRDNAREGLKTINAAAESIKAGGSVYVCPEGTRSHGDDLLPFHEGSYKMADKSGCPIVPIAFTHTDDVFENTPYHIIPTKVTVAIGEPIPTEGLSRKELSEAHDKATECIRQMYNKYV